MKDKLLTEYLFNQQLREKYKKQVPLKEIPEPILKLETLIDEEFVSDALGVCSCSQVNFTIILL
jgi:hypothetical protein